ncbi:MAG: manganese efflux pump [Lachnospiraceae bacterium]|nr:manganese efflux pump [Lachnospiraceae bacterium]
MSYFEVFILGIGLSMDAFAVALTKGIVMQNATRRNTLMIAGAFGLFQALMPLLGWALGRGVSGYIAKIDHWIAFALLAYIGGHMIVESVRERGAVAQAEVDANENIDIRELLVLAIATSIDALAAGITFSFFEINIGLSVTIIGVTTFILSAVGVTVGRKVGGWLGRFAQVAGGVILIFIGIRILVLHLLEG